MAGSGTRDEQGVRDVIKKDGKFIWNGEEYKVIFCDKPILGGGLGEPKTDTFVRAVNEKTNEEKDFKISTKKTDFAYLENHPKEKKLREFFGPECKDACSKNFQASAQLFLRGKKRKKELLWAGETNTFRKALDP